MTITIETPPDVEHKVTLAAAREGLSIEALQRDNLYPNHQRLLYDGSE